MIRFVYLGGQINEDARDFAFYDTVVDKFVASPDGTTVIWDSVEDFDAHAADRPPHPPGFDAVRMRRLIPDWYRKGDRPEDP